MGEYLDKAGLTYFWSKIKEFVPPVSKKSESFFIGKLDSTSTRTVMTAQVDGITELYTGLVILMDNNVAQSNTGVTLNVNNLGAKRIYNNMSDTALTTQWGTAYTALLYYDATRDSGNGGWVWYYGYDTNTNTIGYQLRTNGTRLPMKERVYRYRLLFTSADGTGYVPANTSTSTSATSAKTPTTEKINPFGRIVYYGYSTALAAGDMVSASYQWDQYLVTMGYSFTPITMTEWTPVYLKTTPQTDGSVIIDATNPYVQALPTTEDGKVYIFLGIAINETQIELLKDHPVYCYKDGAVRQWTNAVSDGGSTVSVSQTVTSGTELAGITVDNVTTKIYAPTIPSNLGSFQNDVGYITGVSSSDVTSALGYDPVKTVNGNLPDSAGNVELSIPSATSELLNDSGYLDGTGVVTYLEDLPANMANLVVNGSTAALYNTNGDLINMLNFILSYQSAYSNLIIGQIISSSGSSINARTFEVFQIDIPNSTVVLTSVDNGIIYTAVLTDSGSGLVGTFSSQTIGTYSKPSTGIPASDLAQGVQTSLGLADTALQSFTEADPTVPAWAKASSKPSYTASEVGALASTGGEVTGDITLQAQAGNPSYSIVFQRGTLTDNYNDWKIQDVGGYLTFYERGANSSVWTQRVQFNTTGAVTATTFSGQLSGTISSGTTATTQTAGDSSTKVATTAFVQTAITNALAAYENGNTSTY